MDYHPEEYLFDILLNNDYNDVCTNNVINDPIDTMMMNNDNNNIRTRAQPAVSFNNNVMRRDASNGGNDSVSYATRLAPRSTTHTYGLRRTRSEASLSAPPQQHSTHAGETGPKASTALKAGHTRVVVPTMPVTSFSPARATHIPPMGADHLQHFNAQLGVPGRPATPREPARLSSLHPPTDDPRMPPTRGSRDMGARTSSTVASAFSCSACGHVCRSRYEKTVHIRTSHMLGQVADPVTMKMAGVLTCQRCGTYIVGGKASTHEDNCRYQYDGSDHQDLLDRLTASTKKWMNIPQQVLTLTLSKVPWPDISMTAPAHIHLPRSSQMKVAMASVLSRIADLCAHGAGDSMGHALKLLAWLPRWVLTASPTAKKPADMDQLAVARMTLVLDGEYDDLIAGYNTLCGQWKEVVKPDHDVTANRYKRAEILIKHAQLSDAAATLCSTTPMADTKDPNVFRALLAKFQSDKQAPHFLLKRPPNTHCHLYKSSSNQLHQDRRFDRDP